MGTPHPHPPLDQIFFRGLWPVSLAPLAPLAMCASESVGQGPQWQRSLASETLAMHVPRAPLKGGGVGTACGGAGHLGLTDTETQRGRLRPACGQRCVDSKNSQTTLATTSTSPIRQLLGAADTQTAHPATSSTAPAHQRRGSANAETTPAGAPAAAADRTQRPDATCEGKNG